MVLAQEIFLCTPCVGKNQKGWGFKPIFPSFLHDLKKGNMEQGLQTSDPWS